MRYAGDRLKYTKVKPKRFDNLIVISKDEMKDLHKGIPIQRKGYNILYKVIQSPKGDKEVSVKDVLPNFGTDKKDKDTPATKKAQKEIHKYFVKKYEKEGDIEFKKRMKDTDKNGEPKLSENEMEDFNKEVERVKKQNEKNKGEDWYDEKPIPTKESWLRETITKKQESKSDYYDPDSHTGDSYWDRETGDDGDDDDWLSDFGDDDDDWDDWGGKKETDDYGNKLSKRGDKTQQRAVEFKLRLGAGTLKKQKQEGHHYTIGEDGKAIPLSVFKDPKTNKYYAVDDEGNIYENDTDDFRDMKEPTTNARGFEGAVTKAGQKKIDIRKGKGEDSDEYDKTSFADLLGMLGIETDIDWADPFGSM